MALLGIIKLPAVSGWSKRLPIYSPADLASGGRIRAGTASGVGGMASLLVTERPSFANEWGGDMAIRFCAADGVRLLPVCLNLYENAPDIWGAGWADVNICSYVDVTLAGFSGHYDYLNTTVSLLARRFTVSPWINWRSEIRKNYGTSAVVTLEPTKDALYPAYPYRWRVTVREKLPSLYSRPFVLDSPLPVNPDGAYTLLSYPEPMTCVVSRSETKLWDT